MDGPGADALTAIAEAARDSRRGGATDVDIDVEGRYPDMLAALDWYLAAGRPDDAFRLATALVPFWMATKRIDDGDAWFARALAEVADPPARALYDHGYLVFWAGRYELGRGALQAALAAAEASGDPDVQALALTGSARVALNDDPARAVELLRPALAVTDGTGRPGRTLPRAARARRRAPDERRPRGRPRRHDRADPDRPRDRQRVRRSGSSRPT